MTNNPLIAKWEELHNPKEEPKPDYYKGEKSYAEELEELRDTSTVPITKLISYDIDSAKDSFLQTAEKVEKGEARVTSVTLNRDAVGGIFSTGSFLCTGRTTITFEVEVWDTP